MVPFFHGQKHDPGLADSKLAILNTFLSVWCEDFVPSEQIKRLSTEGEFISRQDKNNHGLNKDKEQERGE